MNSFDISFYCRNAKSDRNGFAPVQVSLIINGERAFINLPRKERPEEFKKAIASKKSNDLKIFLETIRKNIALATTDIIARGLPLTTATLRDYLKNGGIKSYTLDDLFKEYLALQRQRVGKSLSIGVYKKYERVRDTLFAFLRKDMDVTAVTYGQLQAYYNNLQQNYELSSSAAMMTKVKAIMTYAFDNGYIKSNPASQIRVTKGKPKIDYLTPDEIEKIASKKFENQRLEEVRKAFILQLATGLAYIDLKNLTPEDIKEDGGRYYIMKERIKTTETYTAVVLPFGYEMIKSLPKINSNQKYNNYLQELGDLCGIKKHLHTHIARHTYCMYLLNVLKVPLPTASRCLGHSSVKVTQSHYGFLTSTTVLEEVTSRF